MVAEEFSEIRIVDLGGDVRANPKLSGTKHNVFGIQTGVAISFLVKRHKAKGCRIFYARRPELETADEKLAFLGGAKLGELSFAEARPDKAGSWINISENDFDDLCPIATKIGKGVKSTTEVRAIFRLFAGGIKTNRDDWVYDFDPKILKKKTTFFYEALSAGPHPNKNGPYDDRIKWSRDLKLKAARSAKFEQPSLKPVVSSWRPFVQRSYWPDKILSDILTEFHFRFFGRDLDKRNPTIAFLCRYSSNPLAALAVQGPFDYCLLKRGNGGTEAVTRWIFNELGFPQENVTDWALNEFQKRLKSARGTSRRSISKEAIFQYVYAVLNDPVYCETYANELRRDLPRIPFYKDFWQWAEWGKQLMDLHIGYETVEPWKLKRTDIPDEKARQAGLAPKALLKADREAGNIRLDSETILAGVPAEAWDYRLGNRSALEWVLDQYKEKKPRDPTIREKFDTYRFADYKEKVIELLARVTTVSVETQGIVEAMRRAAR